MIVVLTTISEPTNCTITLSERIKDVSSLIIIGDRKGPMSYELNNSKFYSLENQFALDLNIIKELPVNHYSRKNIGYLIAMKLGENCIYETDDDNEPNAFWSIKGKITNAFIANKSEWINIYKHFTNEHIWPRGFLLDRINKSESIPVHDGILKEIVAPVQHGLVDVSPDVDAIWRLTLNKEFYFERKEKIALAEGSWCPFNTQNTWWWEEAFPLLYLPVYCSFRMTDIWKSFIAQRCLWEMGYKIVFHSADVNQKRNLHNLMKDFDAEISGYTKNENLTKTLSRTKLIPGKENALHNLVVCYESLISAGILPSDEMKSVKAWAKDVEKLIY